MKSLGLAGGEDERTPHSAHLTAAHVACLDLDRLFFDLERYKAERGWHNLNLTRTGIEQVLADTSWYRLLIPASELTFDSYDKVRVWQKVARCLLRKYVERYYSFRKREWEPPHLEYCDLEENDPNFPSVAGKDGDKCGYRVLIEVSRWEIADKLNELKTAIEAGKLKPFEFRGLKAIWFDRHLYQPLLFLDGGAVKISPAPLNRGERRFVEDLQTFCKANPDFFAGKELYLLRNLSRGRVVGFFEAGNFHQDFIVWQATDRQQHITFVDPKGIRHVGRKDPKISFYQTVKEIEKRLGHPGVVLDSYIVSNTSSYEMEKQWDISKSEILQRHILFQYEDKDTFIHTLLTAR